MESRMAVVTAFEKPLEIWSVPIPELEPGGVLVKVEAATLCGTDAHRWQHHLAVEVPYVPGHETCGTIVDANGPVVDILGRPLALGDRIITSYASCGSCFWCSVSRQPSLCPNTGFFGAHRPGVLLGGCSEYHYFPPRGLLVRVPESVPTPLAASAACALRTVIHGFDLLGPIYNHETVVVQGAGPLGLYATALARDRGAKRVLVIGAPADRLAVAREFGADDTLDVEVVTDPAERAAWVRELTGGRGADVVANCASSHALVEAFDLVRRGGRITTMGVGGEATLKLVHPVLWKGLRVNFTVMAEPRHFLQALEFIESRMKEVPFEKMLSNTFDLTGTTEALSGMVAMREIKPVILPNLSRN
jgi:L-iditol 2-dehydrogenase